LGFASNLLKTESETQDPFKVERAMQGQFMSVLFPASHLHRWSWLAFFACSVETSFPTSHLHRWSWLAFFAYSSGS